MSKNYTGYQFEKGIVNANNDRALFDYLAWRREGVIPNIGHECEITTNGGLTVFVGKGAILVQGSMIEITEAQEIEITPLSSGFIVATVDLLEQNVSSGSVSQGTYEVDINQCRIEAVPTLVQHDLLNGGDIRMIELASYEADHGTVQITPAPKGVSIRGAYNSIVQFYAEHPTGETGDAYLVVGEVYRWNDLTLDWDNLGAIQGVQGMKGDTGEKGDAGSGLVILDVFDHLQDLKNAHPVGSTGDNYLVRPNYVYVWSTTTNDWENAGELVGEKGERGDDGDTPEIHPVTKHWWISGSDTGTKAEGVDGDTPTINPTTKHWWVSGSDTGVKAEGVDGKDSAVTHIIFQQDIPFSSSNNWVTPILTGIKPKQHYRYSVQIEAISGTTATATAAGTTTVQPMLRFNTTTTPTDVYIGDRISQTTASLIQCNVDFSVVGHASPTTPTTQVTTIKMWHIYPAIALYGSVNSNVELATVGVTEQSTALTTWYGLRAQRTITTNYVDCELILRRTDATVGATTGNIMYRVTVYETPVV